MRPNSSSRALPAVAILAVASLLGPARASLSAAPGGEVRELLGASDHLGIEWTALFGDQGRPLDVVGSGASRRANGNPDFADLYGAVEALLLEENISAGVGVDMSALESDGTLSGSVIGNAVVSAVHDLGNAYVLTTFDAAGELILYAGVERLAVPADTWIEFELNQDRVGVTGGVPWPLHGGRRTDDLLVRLDYTAGVLASAELRRWVETDGGGEFQPLAVFAELPGGPCNGVTKRFLVCSGAPPQIAAQEVYDGEGRLLASVPPDAFVEFGVNVGSWLGGYVDFTSVQVRSPEDIVLGSFRVSGYWGERLEHAN